MIISILKYFSSFQVKFFFLYFLDATFFESLLGIWGDRLSAYKVHVTVSDTKSISKPDLYIETHLKRLYSAQKMPP